MGKHVEKKFSSEIEKNIKIENISQRSVTVENFVIRLVQRAQAILYSAVISYALIDTSNNK